MVRRHGGGPHERICVELKATEHKGQMRSSSIT